jgi:hypothetical protein
LKTTVKAKEPPSNWPEAHLLNLSDNLGYSGAAENGGLMSLLGLAQKLTGFGSLVASFNDR